MKNLIAILVLGSSASAFAVTLDCYDVTGRGGKHSEKITANAEINEQLDVTLTILDSNQTYRFVGQQHRIENSVRTGAWNTWSKGNAQLSEEFYTRLPSKSGDCSRTQYTAETGDYVLANAYALICCAK
jgi:hypothetical protein